MSPLRVKLQLASGDAFLPDTDHDADARALFGYAEAHGVDVLGGTEARGPGNNLHTALHDVGPMHGYRVRIGPSGEWLAAARRFGRVTSADVVPVIPRKPGRPDQGGFSPRGIWHIEVAPTDPRFGGLVRVGLSHWLTRRSDPSGHANVVLDGEIGAWGGTAGLAADLAFYMGDRNDPDGPNTDSFSGAPFTTCWDELGQWPTTHPHKHGGPTIDIVASYDHDRRVKLAGAQVLTDADLHLFSDHYSVVAAYAVQPR